MEIKIPDANVLIILVRPDGQCYLNLDRPNDRRNVLERVGKEYNITFTPKQIRSFIDQPIIGVPIRELPAFLDKSMEDQDDQLKLSGIPIDGENNQLRNWILFANDVNKDLRIAIKADQHTAYVKVKDVIETLQDLRMNRFSLITVLRGMPEGF
jgi:hypothetical protein